MIKITFPCPGRPSGSFRPETNATLVNRGMALAALPPGATDSDQRRRWFFADYYREAYLRVELIAG
ncbi:hypothetical protein [Actinoplanes utahensis]|uniref:hypothetical protein n=1 Tax=Actinoplanes utahensis TaxID=1869 RepID=UPI0012699AF2|nr:hypothetical protein [Actinoplanes utahensis]